jgi:hypothetical protein
MALPKALKKFMKKQEVKYSRKEIVTIALVWLFAILMGYIVYLKLRML